MNWMKNLVKIKLTFIWLLTFAVLILPLQWYQNHKRELEEVIKSKNNLLTGMINCISGESWTIEFNGGVDWATFHCVEVESNLYPYNYRAYHKRLQAIQCKEKS